MGVPRIENLNFKLTHNITCLRSTLDCPQESPAAELWIRVMIGCIMRLIHECFLGKLK